MGGIKIGYARCSTNDQDVTAQRIALESCGVEADRIYFDHGYTGTNRDRPGLREALAACRRGDTLVTSKLDRLGRSITDLRDIADELNAKGVALSFNGSVYDPADPFGKLMFNILGVVSEFEADLIRMRTREGMQIAKAKGRLRGKQPKLSTAQQRHLLQLHHAGEHTQSELAELFGVARSTVWRSIERSAAPAPVPNDAISTPVK